MANSLYAERSDCCLRDAVTDSLSNKEKSLIENRLMYESEHFIIIPSLGPFVEGQIMIVSKSHFPNLKSMNKNVLDDLNKVFEIIKTKTKTIYNFQLLTDNITKDSWPVLGRAQNLLKDALTCIIQADNEGYYNENGDYILWQMYQDAIGTIPAAVLNENDDWIKFELRLNDEKAVERFKQGTIPPRGFLGRLLGR